MQHSSILKFFLLALLASMTTRLMGQQVKLSLQGVLKNFDGTIVDDGDYDVEFRLYNQASGGTAVWEEPQTISTIGGVYNTFLGATQAGLIDLQNVDFSRTTYLGITVVGSPELAPRVELTGTAFALRANTAAFANGVKLPGNPTVGSNASSGDLLLGGGSSNSDVRITQGDLIVKTLQAPSGPLQINSQTSFNNFIETGSSNRIRLGGSTSSIPSVYNSSNNLWLRAPGRVITHGSLEVRDDLEVADNLTVADLLTVGVDATIDDDLIVGNNYSGENRLWIGGINSGWAGPKLQFDADGDIVMETASDDFIRLTSDHVDINGYLRVDGHESFTTDRYAWYGLESFDLFPSGTGWRAGDGVLTNRTRNYSIVADSRIRAQSFHSTSDRRIKQDLQRTEGASDLALLQQIPITSYRYVDQVAHGSRPVTGVIAQEVEAVMPHAVNHTTDFVPTIFAHAVAVSQEVDRVRIQLTEAPDLAVGEVVRLVLPTGTEEVAVLAVEGQRFWVEPLEEFSEQIFVWGKQVDDFHNVDFNQLTSLSISAIQELSRRVEALEAENAALRSEYDAALDDLSQRLLRLESRELRAASE